MAGGVLSVPLRPPPDDDDELAEQLYQEFLKDGGPWGVLFTPTLAQCFFYSDVRDIILLFKGNLKHPQADKLRRILTNSMSCQDFSEALAALARAGSVIATSHARDGAAVRSSYMFPGETTFPHAAEELFSQSHNGLAAWEHAVLHILTVDRFLFATGPPPPLDYTPLSTGPQAPPADLKPENFSVFDGAGTAARFNALAMCNKHLQELKKADQSTPKLYGSNALNLMEGIMVAEGRRTSGSLGANFGWAALALAVLMANDGKYGKDEKRVKVRWLDRL